MADLKSFAQPTNTTLYTDVVDTEKGFHGAHATMVHNGYASPPLGAINLDNPGGATRSFTQLAGLNYTNVILNSPGGYAAPTYSLNLTQCYVAQDIGTGSPGFNFDANDFMDYDRTNNRWRVAINGVEKLVIDNATYFLTQTIRHQANNDLFKVNYNSSAPTDQKLWITLQQASEKVELIQNDAGLGTNAYDRVTRSGATITKRVLNETSGRLLVGQGITDDGVTALQTTSLKAQSLALTAQPFIKFNGSILIGTGFGFSPQFSSGITVNGPNSANLTVSKAGKYVINFEELTAFSATTSQAEFLFNLKKNGSFYSYLRCAFTGNSSFYRGTGLSVVLDLLAGDQLSIDRFDGLAQSGNLSGYLYQLS